MKTTKFKHSKKKMKASFRIFLLLRCTSMYLISKDMDVNEINSIGNYFKIQRHIALIAVLYITVNMYKYVSICMTQNSKITSHYKISVSSQKYLNVIDQ
jgi:hypothetical protein